MRVLYVALALLLISGCATQKSYCQLNYDAKVSKQLQDYKQENAELTSICDKLQHMVWRQSEYLDECENPGQKNKSDGLAGDYKTFELTPQEALKSLEIAQ